MYIIAQSRTNTQGNSTAKTVNILCHVRIYFSQQRLFLKTAKVFGEDVPVVQQAFDKSGYGDYSISEKHNSLEFHINQITGLKKLNIDVGISSQVIETRENEQFLRELKVDVTTPQTFRLSTDA